VCLVTAAEEEEACELKADLERRSLEQQASIGEPLSPRGLSSRVELDEGVETRRVERSIRTHLQQVERPKGREDREQLLLKTKQLL